MQIIIVSQYFYPDRASTGQVLMEVAEDLVSAGIGVKVITGLPNYSTESGEKVPLEEEYKGIGIRRLNYIRRSKDRKTGRIISYISFVRNVWKAIKKEEEYDAVLFVSNPPIVPLIGVRLKKRKKKFKFLYLVHDIYPDIAVELGVVGKWNPMTIVSNRITNRALAWADSVIALGDDMKKKLLEKKTASDERINVIPNWADPEKLYPSEVKENVFRDVPEDHIKLLYTGNIGLYYNLEYLIQAARELQDENCSFIFVGEGGMKQRLLELAGKSGSSHSQLDTRRSLLDNVYFYPYFPIEDYNRVLNSGDILIVTLKEGIEGISVPSKLYSYMAVGKPVLGMISDRSDVGLEIERSGLGLRADPGDLGDFVEKAKILIHNEAKRKEYGTNCLRVFKEKYARKIVTRKFIDLLQ